MKKNLFILLLSIIVSTMYAQDAKQLLAETMEAMGGKTNFYNKGSVSYNYEYNDPNSGLHFVGKEMYHFDGELSRADFTTHTMTAPKGGAVTEGYDGANFWVNIDGQKTTSEEALGFARFLRKTNYYWFTMFFKLLDDGVNQKFTGTKTMNGKTYNIVKITFGEKVGDAQDTYVLYINKETKLIDQFLFTITAFGVTEPNLMRFDYETIDGIKIPTRRNYIKSNWDGEIIGTIPAITTWENIQFGTVDRSIFTQK